MKQIAAQRRRSPPSRRNGSENSGAWDAQEPTTYSVPQWRPWPMWPRECVPPRQSRRDRMSRGRPDIPLDTAVRSSLLIVGQKRLRGCHAGPINHEALLGSPGSEGYSRLLSEPNQISTAETDCRLIRQQPKPSNLLLNR